MSSYATLLTAQDYFDGRLNTSGWDNASEADKTKALIHATRIMEVLNYLGEKTDADQELEFPRGGDTEVPNAIVYANAEIALALLDGIDPELEYEAISMKSQGYANVKSTYNLDTPRVEHLVSGIPSIVAWRYLRPFLHDPTIVSISRV